jgi:hypothetical protein
MQLTSIEQLIWWLNLAASAGLFFRLYVQPIQATYPFVFAFLVAAAMGQVGALASIHNAKLYLVVYVLGQTLKLPLMIFAVLELCQQHDLFALPLRWVASDQP